MSMVSNVNVHCPVCGGYTASTDFNCRTNESDLYCGRCGFNSSTEIVERNGRYFWRVTEELPMSPTGRVAWPHICEKEGRQWNLTEFGLTSNWIDADGAADN